MYPLDPSGYEKQFAMEAMALIEIDGLPFLKMVIFHGYVSHNQRVIVKEVLEVSIVTPANLEAGTIPFC